MTADAEPSHSGVGSDTSPNWTGERTPSSRLCPSIVAQTPQRRRARECYFECGWFARQWTVGHFHYRRDTFEIDDRVLRHIQLVVSQKIRRGERFMLTFGYQFVGVSARSSVWVHPACELHFVYSGSREASVNKRWLEELMSASYSVRGLDLDDVPEPDAG